MEIADFHRGHDHFERFLARGAHGLELLPAEIEILPDDRGAPRVHAPALEAQGVLARVSLTHTRGRAAGIAALAQADGDEGLGIDIERLLPRPEGFARTAFTDAELALLDDVPDAQADEWLLRLWCAREAAGKALGSGLLGGEDAPRGTAIDLTGGSVSLTAGARRLLAWTHRSGELVLATVLHPDPAITDEEGSA